MRSEVLRVANFEIFKLFNSETFYLAIIFHDPPAINDLHNESKYSLKVINVRFKLLH